MFWKKIQLKKLEKLGDGGQGEVYRALRLDPASDLSQIVALKILHSRKDVAVWKQEFESLVRVRSNYCVRVLSFERFKRRPALLLEFVDGLTLARFTQLCAATADDCAEILAQIECGLSDLFRFGLVHGDLSPSNVMIDTFGQIKLVDFGFANDSSRMTPQYAAPERLRGEAASQASDIYSLGCIAEFLCAQNFGYKDSREMRGLRSDPDRAQALAVKVREAQLQEQKILAIRTEAFVEEKGARPWAAIALAFLLAFFPSARPAWRPLPTANVKIHTKRWHLFHLNGRPLGFAPLSLQIEAGQPQKLNWTSASHKGSRSLILRPGEHLQLSDSDFSH